MGKHWTRESRESLGNALMLLNAAGTRLPGERLGPGVAVLDELLKTHSGGDTATADLQMLLSNICSRTPAIATIFGRMNLVDDNSCAQRMSASAVDDLLARAREGLVAPSLINDTEDLVWLLLDSLMNTPSCRLACYGSLRPGEKNFHIVSDIEGTWTTGSVRGFVWKWSGYPVYAFDPTGPEIVVSILESPSLPAHYQRLDEFEGADYQRTLVPVDCGDGMLVCNIYQSSAHELHPQSQ